MQPGDQEYQRLFEIFREECDEHIQKLNDGMLALERRPEAAPLDEILRSAHSLKGASRMMGFKNIETLSHYLETLLTQLHRGEKAATREMIDALYRDIDAIGQSLGALKEGGESPAIDALVGELKVAAGETPAPGEAAAAREKVPAAAAPAPAPRDAAAALATIRVQTEKLDHLINQAGELLVAKIEALDNLRQIEDTLDELEDWRRRLAREAERSPALGRIEKVGDDLAGILSRLSDNTRRLELLVDEIHEGVRDLRLLPLSAILEPFSRMVRDLARDLGKEVELVLEGTATRLDKKILEELREPLIHLVRNAIDHGIEPPEERERKGKAARGTLVVSGRQEGTKILVVVKDDGRGLDRDAIAAKAVERGLATADEIRRWPDSEVLDLIFRPGFSTAARVTELSGRGIGLDAVMDRLERLKGSILTESKPGQGATFTLSLPLTLSTTHALLFRSGGDIFCLPTDALEKTLLLAPDEIASVEGKATVVIDGAPIAFAWLADVLGAPRSENKNGAIPSLLLSNPRGRIAFGVEALLGEEEIVVKALGKFFGQLPQLSGGTILGKGEIALILNPNDLLRSVAHQVKTAPSVPALPAAARPAAAKKRVLVVEDTLTTRTLEKNILEAAGFDVTTAVDGEDALIKLHEKSFDIVVSDVQMPRLDGFALTEKIKKDARWKEVPVILVTALQTDADKRRGIEAGADAYLTKAVFDQRHFLEIIRRFV
jgi:two-component system chemotaxis sensor kinase CheA